MLATYLHLKKLLGNEKELFFRNIYILVIGVVWTSIYQTRLLWLWNNFNKLYATTTKYMVNLSDVVTCIFYNKLI